MVFCFCFVFLFMVMLLLFVAFKAKWKEHSGASSFLPKFLVMFKKE